MSSLLTLSCDGIRPDTIEIDPFFKFRLRVLTSEPVCRESFCGIELKFYISILLKSDFDGGMYIYRIQAGFPKRYIVLDIGFT